jgi:hypothetical protein
MTRASLQKLFQAADILGLVFPGMRPQRSRKPPSVRARRDMERIRAWWSPNIAGFGIGRKHHDRDKKELKKFALRFYVYRKLHPSRVPVAQRIPAKIEFDHLEVEVATDVRQFDGMPQFHFQIASGDEVGHFSGEAGTAGLIVARASEPSQFLLSCAHVLAPPGARKTDPIESPVDTYSTRAINQIGKLEDFFPLSAGDTNPCDAALARLDEGIESSNDIPGIGRPSSLLTEPEKLIGVEVVQLGAVTGKPVSGSIKEMVCTVPFPLRGGSYCVSNLIRYEIESQPGDSGAAVIEKSTMRVLGIHVGAEGASTSAFFSPMHLIVSKFGIDLV